MIVPPMPIPIVALPTLATGPRRSVSSGASIRRTATIRPCLWFDTEGEDAAKFYTSIFPNSKIVDVSRYGSAGPRPEGTVMQVTFELDGQQFFALNGGPDFTFNEAISLEVDCESQEEVDKYWEALTDGGEPGP